MIVVSIRKLELLKNIFKICLMEAPKYLLIEKVETSSWRRIKPISNLNLTNPSKWKSFTYCLRFTKIGIKSQDAQKFRTVGWLPKKKIGILISPLTNTHETRKIV